VARHRRPVNVRDDGLTAVLGPLVTVGGVERAVLLDVDSGMVLDAWACGEAPGGAEMASSAETVPGGGARPGIGSLWRSLGGGDRPAGPGGDTAEAASGDVEAFGARHADLVRALLALPGSPPAELSLVVDDCHHLLRCVADPAGGRLALAVVVVGSPWVVRRVRRHLRQLPDAGLTTGPWLLTWAVGPPPAPWPPTEPPDHAEPSTDGLSSGALDGRPPPSPAEWPPNGHTGPPSADGLPLLSGHVGVAFDGSSPPPPAEWPPNGHPGLPADAWPSGAVAGRLRPAPDDLRSVADAERPSQAGDPWPEAVDGSPPGGPVHDGSEATGDPAAAVPDPRRGPAPPSALPPARSAGSR
jgi:hypothetical protein